MTCGNVTTGTTEQPWERQDLGAFRPTLLCWGFGWAIEDATPDRKPQRRRRPTARRRPARKTR